MEFGEDGTPLYVPFLTDENQIHHLFKRSLILNSTGRVIGSIDQKYLEQIVQEFNKTINSNIGRNTALESPENVVNFEDPIDIPEPELNQLSTQVFQNDNPDWEGLDISDEFLADVDIIYKDLPGNNCPASSYSSILLSFSICAILLHILN